MLARLLNVSPTIKITDGSTFRLSDVFFFFFFFFFIICNFTDVTYSVLPVEVE